MLNVYALKDSIKIYIEIHKSLSSMDSSIAFMQHSSQRVFIAPFRVIPRHILVPLNWYGHPNTYTKFFRMFVKRS